MGKVVLLFFDIPSEAFSMVHLLLAIIYLSFVSLGLPDALLGASWPLMHQEFGVAISLQGIISMIISGCTILSSLKSDWVIRKFGTARVNAVSVLTTAVALWGFSVSTEFWQVCLWAIPYGLGAGSVDAALNNYVAIHYASRHMSWLHCMWALGASIGPYIIGGLLSGGCGWPAGYRVIGSVQLVIAVILFLSLKMWKQNPASGTEKESDSGKALSLRQVLAIPGAKAVIVTFFCYCALETTIINWACSYLVYARNFTEDAAANHAGLFFIGMMVGRGLSGFLTYRFNDAAMVRMGQSLLAVGLILLLPLGTTAALVGLALCGLGCAPIYPSIIHSTPARFGAQRSQAIIGAEMAGAYVGSLLTPPLFGLLANHVSMSLLPGVLSVILVLMVFTHERLCKHSPA